jgi:hypothetical protein
MNRSCSIALALALFLVWGAASTADDKDKPHNPFDVNDVVGTDDEEVKEFAGKVKLTGDDKDANAEQWADKAAGGRTGSLDGVWYSRWNGGGAGDDWAGGRAIVKTSGDRVYILYLEATMTYLIEARREGKKRLVGRYVNVSEPKETTPWVGVIVDDRRIDGQWGSGRWDFRRKLAGE